MDGKAKSLGAFVNEVDAARAYDEAARVLRGPGVIMVSPLQIDWCVAANSRQEVVAADAELNFPNAGEKSHFDNHKRNQAGSSKSSQQVCHKHNSMAASLRLCKPAPTSPHC